MKGVIIFKFDSDGTIVEKYPDTLEDEIVDKVRSGIDWSGEIYKKTSTITVEGITFVITPILLKVSEDERGKPALLAVVSEEDEAGKISELLKDLEKKELIDYKGFTKLVFKELSDGLSKVKSIKDKLKSKEEKMW